MNKRMMVLTALVVLATSGLYGASANTERMGIDEQDISALPSYSLEPIVVTANRTKETVYTANADVSVLTRKDLDKMNIHSVEQALRTVPGLQFQTYGSTGMNLNVNKVRINGSSDVLLLVDGVKVTDFSGTSNGGQIFSNLTSNMDNIERIEVLRGSAGVVYGSTAVGGVINIITKATQAPKTTVDVNRGSHGKEGYHVSTEGKADGLGYRAYFGKDIKGSLKDGAGIHWPGGLNQRTAGTKLSYDFTKNHKVTLGYDDGESKVSGFNFLDGHFYVGKFRNKQLTLQDDLMINDKWSNAFTYRSYKEKNDYDSGTNIIDYKNDYTFITDQVTYTTKDHTLVFGLDYTAGKINQKAYGWSNTQVKEKIENYSFFAQDDYRILPDLTLTAGIRYDKPKSHGNGPKFDSNVSKSFGLAYEISKQDRVHVNYGDFYILPGFMELYGVGYGNPNLKPAKGHTTTLGYAHKFDNGLFTANLFKTIHKEEIGYGYTTNRYENFGGNSSSRGFTVQYMANVGSKWTTNIGWSHLHRNGSDTYTIRGYYPKDELTFSAYYKHKKVEAGVDGFYFIRHMTAVNRANKLWPTNNFGVYNVSVNYSPNSTYTVYGRVDNIFNKYWAENTSVLGWGGGPGKWYSMPGRTFTVGVKATF